MAGSVNGGGEERSMGGGWGGEDFISILHKLINHGPLLHGLAKLAVVGEPQYSLYVGKLRRKRVRDPSHLVRLGVALVVGWATDPTDPTDPTKGSPW